MRVTGPFRAQGVNLFPGELLLLALWAAGMVGCGWGVIKTLGWVLHRVVLLDPKSQSLSNIAHIQGKEHPDCCNKHFSLGPLGDFSLAKWDVCSKLVCKCVWLCTQACRKHRNTGIKRAKSTQLCTMTLFLKQSQGVGLGLFLAGSFGSVTVAGEELGGCSAVGDAPHRNAVTRVRTGTGILWDILISTLHF